MQRHDLARGARIVGNRPARFVDELTCAVMILALLLVVAAPGRARELLERVTTAARALERRAWHCLEGENTWK